MNDLKTLYAVFRAGQTWEGVTTALLEATPDGDLTLARLPGADPGHEIEVAGPYDVPPSGLALGACDDLYLADTAGGRVICTEGICDARMIVPGVEGPGDAPGQFNNPCAVLLGPLGLYVADSGNSRIQVFRLPTLEVREMWEGIFQNPTGLAQDSQGRVYVLDRGLKRLLRFSAWGVPDETYNALMAAQPDLTSPAFLTVAGDDTLFVSDDAAEAVLSFDADGHPLGPLPPPLASPFRPRALAAHGDRLYVADAESGCLWVFDRSAGHYLGTAVGFRGPVAAMSVGRAGVLYIKPGLDDTILHLAPEAACVLSGRLETGALDAGDQSEWVRVSVEGQQPEGTEIQLQLFATDDPDALPAETEWQTAGALDTLVSTVPGPVQPGNGKPPLQRYLWLRLSLTSEDQHASPLLRQVRAETAGESYLNYLPAIYQRDPASSNFLRRWLDLFRSELGDLELLLEAMPRRFDPATTPRDHLAWLATWLAFELPRGWEAKDVRALLLRAYQLYQRRATHFGVSEFVQIYTGVRPQIIEAFHERRLWSLGQTSALGFDTGLAPLAPHGIVVPDPAKPQATDPSTSGAWSEPEALVVGEAVVGRSSPLAAGDIGEALFGETAHRFTVLIPAGRLPEPGQRQAVKNILEVEKPAHTDYHLCFVEARMRVGFQARIGIDSIIAGPPEPLALNQAVLGLDSTLGAAEGEDGVSRVGHGSRLGAGLLIT